MSDTTEEGAAWRSPLPGERPSPHTAKQAVEEQIRPHPTPPCCFWKGSLRLKPGTLTLSFFHPGCFRRLLLHFLVTLLSVGYQPCKISWGSFCVGEVGGSFWSRAEACVVFWLQMCWAAQLWFFIENVWKVSETLTKRVLISYFGIKYSETLCIPYTYFPDNLITETFNNKCSLLDS